MTDKIKNFFERRRKEGKFRGQGHRLDEPAHSSRSERNETEKVQIERAEPSTEAKQAGLAALARLENRTIQPGFIGMSFSAQYKAMKKAALLENRLSDNTSEQSTSDQSSNKDFLAVQGVYFKCPLIGPDILPKDEWKLKIKNSLYDLLESDKAYTSCLMIHTLNKNKEKIEQCIETLCTYLQNIISQPDEEKYKKIRFKNRVFQEKVAKIIGSVEFLESAGFVKRYISVQNEEEEYFVFETSPPDVAHLQLMIDTIRNTEAIPLELDRNVQVLKPAEAKVMVNLPDEFYALTPEEIKREQRKRTESLENSMQLRTKAMREKEEQREIKKYRYTLIRIRFPNGHYLQGTFGIFERLIVVREFVQECLIENVGPFSLSTALGVPLTDEHNDKTLMELKLVPAVMLTFTPATFLKEGEPYLIHDLEHVE
ncbi:hypothetical protein O3M35_003712 [Rhynocoris fuscipes]|uniref:UBX domain-containing protein n=1 Tax=Rhynocoris fuscipes TaxID=488301 RepID=A0AAW1CJX4_9HEMI